MSRFGFRRRQDAEDDAGVDLSPLIDMTFLLLIFFVVSSSFVDDAEIDIERPAARSARPVNARPIRVVVDRSGLVSVRGEETPRFLIETRVRHILEATIKPVLVITDKRVPADVLLDVVDQCRLAGAKKVAVAVEGAS